MKEEKSSPPVLFGWLLAQLVNSAFQLLQAVIEAVTAGRL